MVTIYQNNVIFVPPVGNIGKNLKAVGLKQLNKASKVLQICFRPPDMVDVAVNIVSNYINVISNQNVYSGVEEAVLLTFFVKSL